MHNFPAIAELRRDLMRYRKCLPGIGFKRDDATKVRLQVTEDGWAILTGDPSYDTDHRGYWGSSFLGLTGNLTGLARDLISQCREQEYDDHI